MVTVYSGRVPDVTNKVMVFTCINEYIKYFGSISTVLCLRVRNLHIAAIGSYVSYTFGH